MCFRILVSKIKDPFMFWTAAWLPLYLGKPYKRNLNCSILNDFKGINKSNFILIFICVGTHYFSIVLFARPLTYSPDWTAEYILPLLIGWASKFLIGVTIDSWSKLTKNAIDCLSFDSFDVETWCLKEKCNLFLLAEVI